MPIAFRAPLGAGLSVMAGFCVAAGFAPAWAQTIADGYSGFEIELVCRAPDIEHPSVITCDSEGNLFVGEDPMDMRGPTAKEFDRIVLLRWDEKTGAPRKTVFCQNLASVFGLIWDDGALYVMHAPHYSVFRDTDGDGVADERKDLAEGFGPPAGKYGLNDHIVTGIRLGLDNRVYVSVGDKGIQHAVGSDGSTLTLEGGGVVSMRLDGSQLEVVSSGTRNHLDVAMDSLDNIFTYDNTDDGLGWWTRFTHQVPTGYYGYPYDFRKNPERHLPRISEHGGGSPVGAACYRGAPWPEKFRDNVFYCEWGKSKIQRFVPTRSGATFTATMDDFLVRDGSEEFRPLDLCFSPDGRAMYVADWNVEVWTNPRICGRLFRVRYVGTDVPAEPARVSDDAPLAAQLKALGHPADSERARAQSCLTRLGQPAIAPVAALLASADASKLAKVHALWTLSGIANRAATYDPAPAWIAALDDPDADVRSQAARRWASGDARRPPAGCWRPWPIRRHKCECGRSSRWGASATRPRRRRSMQCSRTTTLSSVLPRSKRFGARTSGNPLGNISPPKTPRFAATCWWLLPASTTTRRWRRWYGRQPKAPTRPCAPRHSSRWAKCIIGPIPTPRDGGESSRPRESRLEPRNMIGRQPRRSYPRFRAHLRRKIPPCEPWPSKCWLRFTTLIPLPCWLRSLRIQKIPCRCASMPSEA